MLRGSSTKRELRCDLRFFSSQFIGHMPGHEISSYSSNVNLANGQKQTKMACEFKSPSGSRLPLWSDRVFKSLYNILTLIQRVNSKSIIVARENTTLRMDCGPVRRPAPMTHGHNAKIARNIKDGKL